MGTALSQQEPPHIWGIGTCVMEMVWIGMSDIIGVPGRDLFMMEMMECSGHHRVYIEPHWLCNDNPCKRTYLLCVCSCAVFYGRFSLPFPWGFPLCVCMPSGDEHHAMYAQFECVYYESAKDNS